MENSPSGYVWLGLRFAHRERTWNNCCRMGTLKEASFTYAIYTNKTGEIWRKDVKSPNDECELGAVGLKYLLR